MIDKIITSILTLTAIATIILAYEICIKKHQVYIQGYKTQVESLENKIKSLTSKERIEYNQKIKDWMPPYSVLEYGNPKIVWPEATK